MSEQLPEESDELAQVLSRMNALMKQGNGTAATPAQAQDIPLLTEVYEGEPLTFGAHAPPPAGTPEEAASGTGVAPDLAESLLAEMTPLLQATVKETVQLELVKLEKVLTARLEAELLQTLRERLKSR